MPGCMTRSMITVTLSRIKRSEMIKILFKNHKNNELQKCKCGNSPYLATRYNLYFVKCLKCNRESKPFHFTEQAIARWNEQLCDVIEVKE